ncbi:MAG: DUF1080 domain-containing protein [Gemmataceae bacterium]
MLRRFLSVIALAACAGLGYAADPPPGFTPLFNGKDFTGWYGWNIHGKGGSPVDLAKLTPEEKAKKIADWTADMKANFKIENGELINNGTGAYPATIKEYGDAEFLIEYKLTKTVDAGIYPKTMPQIQVWDYTDPSQVRNGNAKGSGGLWNNPPGFGGKDPLVRADNPPGEWNKFRIITLGDRVTVYLNDKLVVDHERMNNFWEKGVPLPAKASLLLQTHPPKLPIHWRNLYVREIPAAEANAMLAKKAGGKGFVSIFNGKDLTGWQGAVDSYQVVDGAIVCKPKKGGELYTVEKYSDFVVNLEFKLPKNGNNGLGIRYPGKGDGAYTGMCELQVLDDAYKGIDPRQAHGSAYGMSAAKRGYQRPIGEWNFQTVTVKGSTIVVELNGSRILDTDLSKVTTFLANNPHPGKDLTEGYFSFLGHNDPVAFRNISIKKLK